MFIASLCIAQKVIQYQKYSLRFRKIYYNNIIKIYNHNIMPIDPFRSQFSGLLLPIPYCWIAMKYHRNLSQYKLNKELRPRGK